MRDTKTPVNLRLDSVLLEEMDIKRELCDLPKKTRTWWIEKCIRDNMKILEDIIQESPQKTIVMNEKMKNLRAKVKLSALDNEVNRKIQRLKKCSTQFIQDQIDKNPFYIAMGIYDHFKEERELNCPIDEKFLDI